MWDQQLWHNGTARKPCLSGELQPPHMAAGFFQPTAPARRAGVAPRAGNSSAMHDCNVHSTDGLGCYDSRRPQLSGFALGSACGIANSRVMSLTILKVIVSRSSCLWISVATTLTRLCPKVSLSVDARLPSVFLGLGSNLGPFRCCCIRCI